MTAARPSREALRELGAVPAVADALDPDAVARVVAEAMPEAIVHELRTEDVVLRYGGFYGPGTSLGAGGEYVEQIRKRRLPVAGVGTGVWSFIHIEDAAERTTRRPRPRRARLTGEPTGPAIHGRATLLSGTDERRARRALARAHPILQAIVVPLVHRVMRYRTVRHELEG